MPSHLPGRRAFRAASALTLALGTGAAAPFLLAGPADAATSSATAAFSASDHAILYTAAPARPTR
jgi:serralysin